jgi:hypothetical protein
MRLHDFFCASITSIHRERPTTISFLTGKLYGFPGSPILKIEIIAHHATTISVKSFSLLTGYVSSIPVPTTTTVEFQLSRADLWAYVSQPAAPPDTIGNIFDTSGTIVEITRFP